MRVYSLLIVSRNHFNNFMIDQQKTEICPKEYIAVRAICSDTRVLTVQIGCCPLLNVYFNEI